MKCFSLQDIQQHIGENQFFSDIFDGKNLEMEISYPSLFQNTQYIRDCIEKISDIIGFTAKWKARIILFCDELNNNAIEYGSLSSDQNKVIIEYNDTQKIFRLSIQDTGSGPGTKSAQEMEKLRKKHEARDFSQHHSIR